MKKYSLLILLLYFAVNIHAYSCTSAVISGKYTVDGRPLLWKHRDTNTLLNKIIFSKEGKYSYTGVVNSTDSLNKSIWYGMNSEGFAIMNTASYNINNDTIKGTGREGVLMKRALEECADIDEFEQLLRSLKQPTRVAANYGVIDAKGGAAYFEVGNFVVEKIDVNDPKIAPYGYVIRTNYSFTGEKVFSGHGYIRYETAEKLIKKAAKENNLRPQTIIQEFSRSLYHSLTGVDLYDYSDIPEHNETHVFFTDFIVRRSTASVAVIQGVKKGEDPAYTTMWTVLGWPLSTVCIPVWNSPKTKLPAIFTYNEKLKDSPMCYMGMDVKMRSFPYRWTGHSESYININSLVNADNTGSIQKITPFEDEIFDRADAMLKKWRESEISNKEMQDFYNWVDLEVPAFYKKNFGISINK